MNLIHWVGSFTLVSLVVCFALRRESAADSSVLNEALVSAPSAPPQEATTQVDSVPLSKSSHDLGNDLDNDLDNKAPMNFSTGLKNKLEISSKLKKVHLHPGGAESLEVELDIVNQFGKEADVLVAIQMADAMGKPVITPQIDKKPINSGVDASQQRSFTTPHNLSEGAYVIRAAIAGRDAAGDETSLKHEFFVLVKNNKMTPVSFDRWFEHANEGIPVLDSEVPDSGQN